MFGNLKNKFQSVQEGLSASIRGLTLAEATKLKKDANVRKVNYDAGAEILHHFQLQWNELHELAEENAQKAQEADGLISTVHEKLEQEWTNVTNLNNSLVIIPKINNSIQHLMDQIGSLQELFEEVETSLINLEDLNEILDLQGRQLDHRFQLALYKEKKMSELTGIKARLASEHADRVLKHELKQQKTLRERQETFEEAFKEELEEYKATGSIPRVKTSKPGPTLEEIVLETDTTDFDEFLKS